MKHKTSKLLVVLTAVALIFAIASFTFADTVGTKEIKDYSGTVTYRYGGGFFLKSDSGDEYKLVVGPPWYLEDLGLELKQGDRITVTGIVDDGVLFAGKVKKGARTYEIADLENFEDFHCPMWRHGSWGPGSRGPGDGRWNRSGKGPRGYNRSGMM